MKIINSYEIRLMKSTQAKHSHTKNPYHNSLLKTSDEDKILKTPGGKKVTLCIGKDKNERGTLCKP